MNAPFLKSDCYTAIPCVVYYRLEPKKRAVRVNYVCFGNMMDRGVPSAIRYIAPINDTMIDNSKVARGAVDHYLAFMKQVLTRPESPKFLFKKIKGCVHFRLESKGLKYRRALFFLTWFRYVHHYPEIIHRLYERRDPKDTLENTFEKFFMIHNEMVKGKFRVSSQAASNETVIFPWSGDVKPVTLASVWDKMKIGVKSDIGVQEHLRA